MIMSESIIKIAPALLKAQMAMKNASKDANNPFFNKKYADLNSIREACHPALNENGITVMQLMTYETDKVFGQIHRNTNDTKTGIITDITMHQPVTAVRTLLLHESGEYIGSDTPVIVKEQNNPQALGSAISYARRYGLQAIVSLGAEDDDGNKASNGNGNGQAKAPEAPKALVTFRERISKATTSDDLALIGDDIAKDTTLTKEEKTSLKTTYSNKSKSLNKN